MSDQPANREEHEVGERDKQRKSGRSSTSAKSIDKSEWEGVRAGNGMVVTAVR